LQPGDVLDAGCGSGRMYGALREAGLLKGRRYVGGDASTEMLALARANYPGAAFAPLDILALEEDSADNVLCFQVLQHLSDWRPALAQLAGAARRVLYVATWFGNGDRHLDRETGSWNCWLDYGEFLSACREYGNALGRPGVFGQTGSVAVFK
jgi:SAM-dependent methyltransferase